MTVASDGLYEPPYTPQYDISTLSFPTLGTKVTIDDTAPTTNAFNMVDVEIL